MNELKQYLQAYMGMAEEEMDILTSYFHLSTLSKGDYYLRAGKVCDKLGFHISGLMRVYAMHEDKEVTQWISYKGNLISDLGGLVFDEPSRFNMQALNQCELYTISKKDYNNLSQVMSNWPLLERRLISRCFGFMEKRVFSLLSLTAEERYKFLFAQNPDLFTEVPLKYLASMMGITPESLSRTRKKIGLYDLAVR